MKKINLNKKNGFSILAIILVIVAVISAIAVWALTGKTNTNNSGDSSNSVLASGIIQDTSSFKLAYDTLVINGTSNIVFVPGLAAANNMLDPKTGVEYASAAPNAIRSGATAPEGKWVYMTNFYSANGPSQADPAVVLTGVKDSVCQQINKTLYGSTYVPAFTPITSSAAVVSGATVAAPTSSTTIDFNSVTEFKTIFWTAGCFASNANLPDNNIVFKILKIN